MIREGVAAALTQKHAPLVLPPPITVEVDFALTIHADMAELCPGATRTAGRTVAFTRSEEHTSELQSQSNLVCRLLLEKKKYLVLFVAKRDCNRQSRFERIL